MHPSGLTFHDQALIMNEAMSPEKSKANIARVMNYFIPRACVALDLGCNVETSTETFLAKQIDVNLIPNPAQNSVTISVGDHIVKRVDLYGVDGRLNLKLNDVQQSEVVMGLDAQPPGMYLLKI